MAWRQNIRVRRKQLGMTQAELAAAARLRRRPTSAAYISRVESGEIDPPVAFLRSVSRALKVPVWWLLSEAYDSHPITELWFRLTPSQKREARRIMERMLETGCVLVTRSEYEEPR